MASVSTNGLQTALHELNRLPDRHAAQVIARAIRETIDNLALLEKRIRALEQDQ
jgi:hypothetical protein